MSLETKLAAPPANKGTQTALTRWVEALPTTERNLVHKAILDPTWRHIDLQRVLEEEGAPKIADTTFGVWRRKNGYTG